MVKKKIDPVSRVVAFITAFAIAMLTVTLIHRTVISAESGEAAESVMESIAESSEASEELETTAASPNESNTQETLPPDEEQNRGELYSSEPEETTDESEETAYAAMPDFQNDEGEEVIERTETDANGILFPDKSETGIFLNGSPITAHTNVSNGQRLSLNLKWRIPEEKNGDFSNTIFKWDITDEVKNIKIDDLREEESTDAYGNVTAIYDVINEDGRLYIYITPQKDFDENFHNKNGSLALTGTALISEEAKEAGSAYLQFFTGVKVQVPKSKLYTNKSARGIYKKGDKYYQKFEVYVQNTGDAAAPAESTVMVDIPGDMFIGTPINPAKYKGYISESTKESVEIDDKSVDKGFLIKVGKIEAGGIYTVTYDMEIDKDLALSLKQEDAERKKNVVSIQQNPSDSKSPTEAEANMEMILPQVNKNGAYNAAASTIIWKITVSPNFLEDAEFTVTDTPDVSLDFDGSTLSFNKKDPDFKYENGKITIPKDKFKKDAANNIYVFEYTTPVPESLTSSYNSVSNKAELTFTEQEYEQYKDENSAYVSVSPYEEPKDPIYTSITKKCNDIVGDSVEWEGTVYIPDPDPDNESANKSRITDMYFSDYITKSSFSHNNLNLKYGSTITFTANDKEKYTKQLYSNGSGFSFNSYDDPEFLSFLNRHTDQYITFKYCISVDNGNIDQLISCENYITCNISYEGGITPSVNASAEYMVSMAVSKSTDGYYFNNGGTVGTDGDIYSYAAPVGDFKGYEWTIDVDIKKDLEAGSVINVLDYLPEGMTFRSGNFNGYPHGAAAFEIAGVELKDQAITKNENDNIINVECIPGTPQDMLSISIEMKNKDDIAKLNASDDNKSLKIHYITDMKEDYYKNTFSKLSGEHDFINFAIVDLDGKKSYTASASHSLTAPKKEVNKNNLLEKTCTDNGSPVTYTVTINPEKEVLGDENKPIVLTDVHGYKLSLKTDSIKIQTDDGEVRTAVENKDFRYDKDKYTLTMELENGHKHVITYEALFSRIGQNTNASNSYEDNEILKKYFENNATISYSMLDGGKENVSKSVELKNVRANSDIASSPFIKGNGDSDSAALTISKLWIYKDGSQCTVNRDKTIGVKITPMQGDSVVPGAEPHIVMLLESNNWEASIRLDNVTYTKYRVEELPVEGSMYTPQKTVEDITLINDDGTVKNEAVVAFENVYDPPKTTIKVKKDWHKSIDENTLPDSVVFSVTGGGIEQTAVATKSDWTATFSLPQFDKNGYKIYSYSLSEKIDANSDFEVLGPNNTEIKIDSAKFEYKVTNIKSYKTTPEPEPDSKPDNITITVKKVWDDSVPLDEREQVTFKIFQDNKENEFTLKDGENILSSDNWTSTITVPKGHDYFIVEDKPYSDKYSVSVSQEKISKDDTKNSYRVEIINSKKTSTAPEPETITITVKKEWDGSVPDSKQIPVKFKLLQDGEEYTELKTGENILSKENEWKSTITVPKGHVYTVVEEGLDTTKYKIVSVSPTKVAGDANETVTITNSLIPKINIKVNKEWVDVIPIQRPTSIKFRLLADTNPYKINNEDVFELTADKDWTKEFTELDMLNSDGTPIDYKVEEVWEGVNPYHVKITRSEPVKQDNGYYNTEFKIKNRLSKAKINVKKNWDDYYEKGIDIPQNIEIYINKLLNNKIIDTKAYTLSSKNEWDIVTDWLDLYDENGNKYSYTITEEELKNNSCTPLPLSLNEETGFYDAVIVNTYVEPGKPTVDITVKKTWDNVPESRQADSIEFQLLKDGTPYKLAGKDTFELNGVCDWETTFSSLPKLDENNKEIVYSVKEIMENDSPYTVKVLSNNTENENGNVSVEFTIINSIPLDPTKPDDPTINDDPKEEPDKPSDKPVIPPNYPVVPPYGYTVTTVTETTTNASDTEDVSAEAGFTEESDAVKRDTIMIFILLGIIITGSSILVYRRHSADYDKKYHM